MSIARALMEIDRLLGAATRVGGALATAAAVHAGAASAAQGQPVFFVDDDAPAGGDGRSWSAAYRDVQQALDEIRATRPGSPVVVKIGGGVYRPDRGTRDRGASFMPTSGVVMVGGFAGVGANDPELNDPARFETVLSGDLNGDDGAGFVRRDDNAATVVRVRDADNVVFRGLTIRGATYGGIDAREDFSSRTIGIEHCRVVDNDGAVTGAVMVRGGVVLLDSRIEGNRTQFGAEGVVRANAVIAMRSIVAGNDGPAFGAVSGTSVWLEQCVLAGSGSAVLASGADAQITVRNSTVVTGRFEGQASGLFNGYMRVVIDGSVVAGVGDRPYIGGELRSLRITRSCLNLPEYALMNVAVTLELGAGILLLDPLLVSPAGADGLLETTGDNDYRLRAGSPAIDFGDVAALSPDSGDLDGDGDRDEPTPRDLMGMPRLVDDPGTMNQGVGAGSVLDLGALEFQGVSCRVDLDLSGVVGVGDWFVFVTRWLARDTRADFDRSGVLDEGDVFDYLAAWFAGCW